MKRQLCIILSLGIILGLLGAAIYQYDTRPTVKAGETLQQAVSAQAATNQTLIEHDAVNTAAVTHANNQISTLTAQKSTLCAQIETAKLVQPLCQ